jgi:hypothetical protein
MWEERISCARLSLWHLEQASFESSLIKRFFFDLRSEI